MAEPVPCPHCNRILGLYVSSDAGGPYIGCRLCGYRIHQTTLEASLGIQNERNKPARRALSQPAQVMGAIKSILAAGGRPTLDSLATATGMSRTQVRLVVNRLEHNRKLAKTKEAILPIAA